MGVWGVVKKKFSPFSIHFFFFFFKKVVHLPEFEMKYKKSPSLLHWNVRSFFSLTSSSLNHLNHSFFFFF